MADNGAVDNVSADAEELAPLTGLDGLWLTLDTISEFEPTILNTWTFGADDDAPARATSTHTHTHDGASITLDALRGCLYESVKRFPRFACRLQAADWSSPRFVRDPDFDIAKHVVAVELPAPAGRREFDDFCAGFVSRHWDFGRSPWDVALCTNYRDEATGATAACVARVYHAIADGQGLVRASLWGSDYRSEVEKLTMKPKASPASAPPRSPSTYLGLARDFVATSAWTAYSVVAFGVLTGLTSVHRTHLTPSNLGARIDPAVAWRDKPARSRTFGPHEPARQRTFARSRAVTIADIKLIQQAFSGSGERHGVRVRSADLVGDHVTLNDVIVSILAEVFHAHRDAIKAHHAHWIQAVDSKLPDRISFLIPISTRLEGDPIAKNRVAMGIVYVHKTGVAEAAEHRTPADVYESIHRQRFELGVMKRTRLWTRVARRWLDPFAHRPAYWPWPGAWVPGWEALSSRVTTPIVNAIFATVHAVVTNVPGPPKAVRFAGAPLVDWSISPPQGSAGTQGVGIMTYNGRLVISCLADVVPGAESNLSQAICDAFEETFGVYLRIAKQVLEAKQG